ncbi:mycofactocin system protein MftB [Rhodococcus sp. WMMA185]|uniref:mycofactocin biosynthesis chaperone MftB n=1 Tax=Rhodococcus sp. WMMA185 TaxID=679318 RepID=UPI00087819DA|nr:mycofactocin biosynthesis chaperone MftB [Rhodococcus sp. WMMA185]AOW92037.1 mycofactocin system protein MftB [Rhodococcus sp. WMMA185]
MSAPAPASTTGKPAIDLDVGWKLHHRVALRHEPFGALLYHFGTRKLSFLKNRTIVAVVEALPSHADARSALRAQGIGDDLAPKYARALGALAESHMIIRV